MCNLQFVLIQEITKEYIRVEYTPPPPVRNQKKKKPTHHNV